ncbi:MAG: hypothetical protein PWQ55_871 [Chloroflexota bacterium]|nr:hypothetical protein [Chloroflexota bacterium]
MQNVIWIGKVTLLLNYFRLTPNLSVNSGKEKLFEHGTHLLPIMLNGWLPIN